MHARISSQAAKQPSQGGNLRRPSTQQNVSNHPYSSLLQLQRTIGNKAVQQMIVGTPMIQAMRWPAPKQQTKLMAQIDEHWSDLDKEDVKVFYEWCTSDKQFEIIPKELSHSEWKTLRDKCTGAQMDDQGFSGDPSEKNVRNIFTFLTAKKVIPFKSFDMGTYVESNELLAADIASKQTQGVFNLDRIIELDKSFAFDLVEADKERHAALWEKDNNTDLEREKILSLNQRIKAAKEKIQIALTSLVHAHETRIAEEKEAAKKKAKIDDAILAAEQSYAITGCSPLTQAIWNSTKANAGATGYLEIGGSYSAQELQTAHDEWRSFGIAYDSSDGKVDFLDNIHSPGTGKAQDKTGHANYESRSCSSQVDFISTWGGSRTVMHVGLQGTEK
ncbi:hypothetical protein ACYEXS_08615 [Paenibacillus sp. MAH-36]|uniref:Uncharacterized protein n=1 Tax=Paenibacillus violae TaxID=3077234 RepID=A0ABU3R8D1_9BACL|nr:hypothetical protein [Paenibacillus sp. PFR10]MDU0200535.1 hypothetical protein [Paenibacillus sp. PFR10]